MRWWGCHEDAGRATGLRRAETPCGSEAILACTAQRREAPVQQPAGTGGWTGFDGLGLALMFHLETVHLGRAQVPPSWPQHKANSAHICCCFLWAGKCERMGKEASQAADSAPGPSRLRPG